MTSVHKLLILISVFAFCIFSCSDKNPDKQDLVNDINKTINNWHHAAAVADTIFFDYMTDDAIYIGTDATERWSKDEFKAYSMPHFERGRAWNFKPLSRHVYLTDNMHCAYFDEVISSWMGVGRCSGVVKLNEEGKWKIKYYHLSIAIPNEKVHDVLKLIGVESKKDTVR